MRLEVLVSNLHSLTERFSRCDTNELTLSKNIHHSQSMSITDLYALSQNTLSPGLEKGTLKSNLNIE